MKMSGVFHLALMLAVIPVCCGMELAKTSKPVHDVAITDVSVPSNYIQGESVPITVSIANQGIHKETFQAILTDTTDSVLIGMQSVTLSTYGLGGIDGICDGIFSGETGEETHYGTWLSSGDLNGDGCDDFIGAGASRYGNNQGRCYIYYGGPKMDFVADLILTGENVNEYFSENAWSGGDLNGDGYEDLIIGAPGYNNFQGRIYVYYGGLSMDGIADLTLVGENSSDWFGWFCALGDINGDSFDDMIVTASHYQNSKGRAYVYYGGDTLDTTVDKIIDGPGNELDLFGYQVCIGNVNGDSFGDILISAENYPDGDRVGRVYLYYGGVDMDTVCDKTFTGEVKGGRFGNEVLPCDIDNDGYDDVAIGAPDAASKYVGRVYLYWGAPDMDVTADWITTAEGSGSGHGNELQYGNFNNDNYPDLYVGQYSYPDKTNIGRFCIYYGNTRTLFDKTADVVIDSPDQLAGNRFSNSAASGDYNGDNYTDVIVGSSYNNWEGRDYLYYCNPFDYANILFDWDTTNASIGKHTLKASIAPLAGEEDVADNTVTVTVKVNETSKTVNTPR